MRRPFSAWPAASRMYVNSRAGMSGGPISDRGQALVLAWLGYRPARLGSALSRSKTVSTIRAVMVSPAITFATGPFT
jgi:hypothetical protein